MGKTQQISRLENEMKSSKPGTGPRKGGPGPCLSRTGSVERNVEDQLLKDLQDSIERENDLKEQLSIAEEDAGEARKKLSRLEDENESLSGQLKRMSTKKSGTRRSTSPYNRNSVTEKDEGISEDGEELSPGELKVQLEVAEQETGLLRKKVEEDPWSVRKTSFQKSRSVDVAMDGSGAAASRFADYTTTASAAKETKAEEDIPDWKRRMLERQKKDQEKKEEEEAKNRNFGFVPGTTLHSSYVNKSYDPDSRLSSWGSASNLRASSYSNLAEAEEDSSSYRRTKESSTESSRASVSRTSRSSVEKAPAEMTPYEKYLQRKREQEKKDEEESNKKEEAKKEEERRKEREKRREEERKREEEIEKERVRKREKEREERRLEEERKRKEEEEKEEEEEEEEEEREEEIEKERVRKR